MPTSFQLPESPVSALGHAALFVALIVAAYASAAGIIGNVQRRRRLVDSAVFSLYGFSAVMMVASAMMVYAFVSHDYAIKYVSKYSDTTMPLSYKIAAYWGGLDGSIMFWVSVLSVFAALAIRVNRKRHSEMIGYVVATIMLVQVFFLLIMIYAKNPFDTYVTAPPDDGEGLNPLLQNYWMVIHPPSLYIGFVAATIPFAFGIGALASGRLDDKWLGSVRTWTFICWFFLSFGLILGGRWAYEELGWGGYWAWDPVENAGLIPWFTATAFLHAAIIQEQRGTMKIWNLVLVITTFFWTIFGTFMTRSGIVQSVHAFGKDDQLALMFILFMALIMVVSFGLLLFRLPRLRTSSNFESFVSRDFAFLLNNWILLACAFFVLFATMFPTISESINGERITVGPEFFNKWMTPLGMVLLFLAGAAPLLAWRKTTVDKLYAQFLFPTASMVVVMGGLAIFWPVTLVRTPLFVDNLKLPVSLLNFGLVAFVFASVAQEYWKGARVRMKQTGGGPMTSIVGLALLKRRKYGGYIIHVGIAVMFMGFAGKAYETMQDVTVGQPGVTATTADFGADQKHSDTFKVRNYVFHYEDLTVTSDDHKRAVTAHVSVYRDGELLSTLTPARWHYAKSEQPTTEVDMHNRLDEDVYLILTGYTDETRGKIANFRIYINPLINWVWIGFAFLALGTVLCLIPQRLVDNLSPRRETRLGRAAEILAILLTLGAVTFGMTRAAQAQAPPGAGAVTIFGAKHGDGVGAAHQHRPESTTAHKLMKELVCLCGGCQRESVFECRCGYAAGEREKINRMLAGADLDSDAGRKEAYDEVISAFVTNYGERVLATPTSKLAWTLPALAIGGGLILLFGFGRMWVRRGSGKLAVGVAPAGDALADEEYAEMLDDELRETD